MAIKSFAKLLAGTAIGLAVATGGASATTLMTFGITLSSNVTTNTGPISAGTTSKTIPTADNVTPGSENATAIAAGIIDNAPATFSTGVLKTTLGPDAFTITVGDETLSFTSVDSAVVTATGANSNGTITEQFDGTITADTSGQGLTGQTVSLSESCTQTGIDAPIICGESLRSPGLPIRTPEPVSMAIVGVGVIGLGLVRRRRR